MDKKHSKITKYEDLEDGSIKIVTESYFEELSSRREEVVQNIKTNHNDWLADVISCTDVIKKQQTKNLQINILLDDWNQPTRIVKQYIVRKEDFKRR